MAFQMVDANGRNAQRVGEAASERGTREQRAGQPGPLGIGDGADLADFPSGPGEDLAAERHQPADMVAGSEFGNHAPVGFVHRGLRMNFVGEQAPGLGVVERQPGLVAGGLDSENQHGEIVSQNPGVLIECAPFRNPGNLGTRMPTVRIKENEPFEVAMRRFKRTVEKTGLLTELRARDYNEKPTTERKRKLAAAVKRHHKRLRGQLLPKKMY